MGPVWAVQQNDCYYTERLKNNSITIQLRSGVSNVSLSSVQRKRRLVNLVQLLTFRGSNFVNFGCVFFAFKQSNTHKPLGVKIGRKKNLLRVTFHSSRKWSSVCQCVSLSLNGPPGVKVWWQAFVSLALALIDGSTIFAAHVGHMLASLLSLIGLKCPRRYPHAVCCATHWLGFNM